MLYFSHMAQFCENNKIKMNSDIQRNFWICFRILKYFISLAKKEYKKFAKLGRNSLKD